MALTIRTRLAFNHQPIYLDSETGLELTLEQAIWVSASCCAQVSYRRSDTSIAKAERIYRQLIESKPAHASPVEHQARPIHHEDLLDPAIYGITHQDTRGQWWSANFRGWIQYRKTIPDNCLDF
jgi:hypothetical protein